MNWPHIIEESPEVIRPSRAYVRSIRQSPRMGLVLYQRDMLRKPTSRARVPVPEEPVERSSTRLPTSERCLTLRRSLRSKENVSLKRSQELYPKGLRGIPVRSTHWSSAPIPIVLSYAQ